MTVPSFDGVKVADLAKELGVSVYVTKDRLNKAGYGVSEGIAYRKQTAQEVQDEVRDRVASRPPAFPCPRCNAARGCSHRIPAWGVAA